MASMGQSQAFEKSRSLGFFVFIVWMSGFTLVTAYLGVCTLSWEIYWDHAGFLYYAWLANERGYALYRDVLDVNMPGVHLFTILVSKVIGYGDFAWRFFDLLWVGAMAAISWKLMARFSWRVAWPAAVIFSWAYLNQKESQAFQRDYLMILPIALACLVAISTSSCWQSRPRLKIVLIGALFGIAASLKPQAAFFAPWVVCCNCDGAPLTPPEAGRIAWVKEVLWRGVYAMAGFLATLAAILLWLWVHGGLTSFLNVAATYWPVYSNQVFDHAIVTGTTDERRFFVLQSALDLRNLYSKKYLVFPSLLMPFFVLDSNHATPNQRATARLLLYGALCYFLEVILVGNFHPYSWMPLIFFMCMLISLAFGAPAGQGFPRMNRILMFGAAFVIGMSLFVDFPRSFMNQISGGRPMTQWTHRVLESEKVMKLVVNSGDKLQPLDWLGGTSRIMLRLGMEPATPYLADAGFYHESRHPVVMEMRQDFLWRLRAAPPRFIMKVRTLRLSANDPNDDGSFDREVAEFITQGYMRLFEGSGYEIFIRNESINPQ